MLLDPAQHVDAKERQLNTHEENEKTKHGVSIS